MKKYLIPNTKQHKANLHCHTVYSDGIKTPEQIKQEYMEKGYGIVAFTDHEYIVNHQDLTDDNFIAITAYEANLSGNIDWRYDKCAHLNLYARNPYEDTHVLFNPDIVNGYKLALPLKASLKYHGEIYNKTYADVQRLIDEANAHGFLVSLNHPYWSLQSHKDYFDYKGLFAMEVYNTDCSIASCQSWYDYGLFCCVNPKENVAPIAVDDNHKESTQFGGYTMICTDDFSYDGIIKAMENRDLYASTGIDIKEMYIEDGVLHVECSECTEAAVYLAERMFLDYKNENGMTSIEAKIHEGSKFARILLYNKKTGAMATTKPYSLKDFQE